MKATVLQDYEAKSTDQELISKKALHGLACNFVKRVEDAFGGKAAVQTLLGKDGLKRRARWEDHETIRKCFIEAGYR